MTRLMGGTEHCMGVTQLRLVSSELRYKVPICAFIEISLMGFISNNCHCESIFLISTAQDAAI